MTVRQWFCRQHRQQKKTGKLFFRLIFQFTISLCTCRVWVSKTKLLIHARYLCFYVDAALKFSIFKGKTLIASKEKNFWRWRKVERKPEKLYAEDVQNDEMTDAIYFFVLGALNFHSFEFFVFRVHSLGFCILINSNFIWLVTFSSSSPIFPPEKLEKIFQREKVLGFS